LQGNDKTVEMFRIFTEQETAVRLKNKLKRARRKRKEQQLNQTEDAGDFIKTPLLPTISFFRKCKNRFYKNVPIMKFAHSLLFPAIKICCRTFLHNMLLFVCCKW